MDANYLPKEMWIHIFECLNSPTDLSSIIRTSKVFYSLAIRVLCRRLTWTDPRHFAHNLPFWATRAALTDVPRSLTIGISEMPRTFFGRFYPATAVIALDGTPEGPELAALGLEALDGEFEQYPRKPSTFFASPPLYQAMSCRLCAFMMLQELAFSDTFLPHNMFAIIHGLPQLRRLVLQYCTLPPRQPGGLKYDNSLLPLTDLTLWRLRGDVDDTPDSNYVQALTLATARNLRTMRIDWSMISARYFGEPSHDPAYEIPKGLENVEFRLPPYKVWPKDSWASQRYFINPLRSLLTRCPTIVCLTIMNYMPSLPLPPDALPHLHTYTGPMPTVLSVTAGRPVDHLHVPESGRKLPEFLNMLSLLENRQRLKSLSVSIDCWDDEILYPVSQLFPSLQKLKILYGDSCPSEYVLLSMGSQFLYRLPDLHTVQIYKPMIDQTPIPMSLDAIASFTFPPPYFPNYIKRLDKPTISLEDMDLEDLILAWNKSCRKLREVQLVRTSAWRRAFEGDVWCKRVVEREEPGMFE